MGKNHYVQVVNSRVVMYNKAAPNAIVKQVSLNSFFGYTGAGSNLLFDRARCMTRSGTATF